MSARQIHGCRLAPILAALLFAVSSAADQEVAILDVALRRPQRTGYIADAALADLTHVAWRYRGEADKAGNTLGVSNPSVANGMVLFGDDAGFLHAMSAKGGLGIWKQKIGARIYNAPVADRQRVYVSTTLGITAVTAGEGFKQWHCSIEHGAGDLVLWPPKKTLYAGGADGLMRALDVSSGRVKWQQSLVKNVPPNPEGFDGKRARIGDSAARPRGISTDGTAVYQSVFDQSRVVAFDCETGEQLWSRQTEGWVGGTPSVGERHVYIGSQDRHMYALNKKSGEVVWAFATGSRVSEGPGVHNGRVFFGSCDGGFYCLRADTGELLWKVTTDPDKTGRRFIYSKPLVTENAVCFATGEGQVYGVDAATGKLLYKLRPSAPSQIYCSPATDGTRIFVNTRPDWDDEGEASIVAIE